MASKVTFDTATQTIKISSGITAIDFKEDIFSDGKRDWLENESLSRIKFPIQT